MKMKNQNMLKINRRTVSDRRARDNHYLVYVMHGGVDRRTETDRRKAND